ncbi:MAG: hypothetical protein G4V63_18055 [Candidatus Afipia apatlaquensis]|jgi:hypothetical protein|uniref:DUF680 domain-containing protein n=1 Tax=Candidatus Afipia apatlaquensis TaxID=2712852 RepID=A0A7C9RHJ0_9BRAD|nr:hypothetical protein [Candidatus Afipia apatlaquensis]
MKFVLMAMTAVLLFAGQAHAQGRSRPDTSGGTQAKGEDPQKRMAREEAAAKAAMKNVPDSKEKYDPWKIGK